MATPTESQNHTTMLLKSLLERFDSLECEVKTLKEKEARRSVSPSSSEVETSKITSRTQPRRGIQSSMIATAAAALLQAAQDATHCLPRTMTGRQGHGHGHGHDLPDTGGGDENRDRQRTALRARNHATLHSVN